MIAEKLENFSVDIDRLRSHLLDVVLPSPPVMQDPMFGGWSVLSATGAYDDGWQQGHLFFKTDPEGQLTFDNEGAQAAGWRHGFAHKSPTEICTGYLNEVMQKIEALKLYPRRARISFLIPGGETDWHLDGKPETYAVRLHIPIITNGSCEFITEEGSVHLPADGSAYLLRVNRYHQAVNRGAEKRYHLIMDAWDTAHISRHHRYTHPTTATAVK